MTNYGLLPLPEDPRDFKFGALYGVDTTGIPDNFVVAEPLKIKDQGGTDFCTGYAITAVSEDQEGILLSPEFQFYATKLGDESWGADLRAACKSACDFGSLPQEEADKLLKDKYDRKKILDKWTWSLPAFTKARYHAKKSYIKIDGDFDSIRAALWKHRKDKRTVVAGVLWRSEWIEAKNGIIPKEYGAGTFGHAFKFFGQKKINGELYLMAQLSNGKRIGDEGIFYFPRSVVDKEVTPFGAFMFTDLSPEYAKYYMENGIKVDDNWVKAALKVLSTLLGEYFGNKKKV